MFQNKKIAFKLLVIIIPVTILMIVSSVFLSVRQLSMLNQAKAVYYDQIGTINSVLLNCDRDFYQAYASEEILYYGSELISNKAIKTSVTDYQENAQQVMEAGTKLQKLYAADPYLNSKFMAGDQTQTNEQLIQSFIEGVNKWYGSYNPADGSGNYITQSRLFPATREYLNQLEDNMEAYTVYESNELHTETYKSVAMVLIVNVVLIILVMLLAVSIIRYIRKNVVRITKEMNVMASHDLSVRQIGRAHV